MVSRRIFGLHLRPQRPTAIRLFKTAALVLLMFTFLTVLRSFYARNQSISVDVSLYIKVDDSRVSDAAPSLLPPPAARKSTFEPLNDGGVRTFDAVCIEATSSAVGSVEASEQTRRIVVYGGSQYSTQSRVQRISVVGAPDVPQDQWTIHFADGSIPSTHRQLNDSVAYFVSPTCPGNLHRFWAEEFVGLWSVISRTGRLYQGAQNHILYNRQFQQLAERELPCSNVKRYETILQSLYISPRHEAYWKTPTNTCFAHGVFGARFSGTTERDVIGHVRRHVLGDDYNLAVARSYDVTIINRRRRKIVNVEQLAAAARQANFSNVRIVDLDSLTVTEQMRVAVESCVMVGVTGTDLQWASFMPLGLSTVVEIAWPAQQWNFQYDFLPLYGLQRLQLTVDPAHVHPNWTSYEVAVLDGRRTNDTERQHILETPSASSDLWKWADVIVNVTEFVDLLSVHCRCEDYFKPAFAHIDD